MTSRGGDTRKRGQKHQNSTAYKAAMHEKERRQALAQIELSSALCHRCREKLEWRKKFDKYKPLTVPKKCVGCQAKKITQAYLIFCTACVESRQVCPKCGTSVESQESEEQASASQSVRQGHAVSSSNAEDVCQPVSAAACSSNSAQRGESPNISLMAEQGLLCAGSTAPTRDRSETSSVEESSTNRTIQAAELAQAAHLTLNSQ